MVQFNMLTLFFSLSSHFMLFCCTELTTHLHPGIRQHVILALLHNWIGFCHGQILIETATHSYILSYTDKPTGAQISKFKHRIGFDPPILQFEHNRLNFNIVQITKSVLKNQGPDFKCYTLKGNLNIAPYVT